MKKKDRLKLLNYAKEQYSEYFNMNFEFKKLSKKKLLEMLKQNKHSSICEWSYCCHGLYQSCWQDLCEEGIWNFKQNDVDNIIKSTIEESAKICRRDNRILYCEDGDDINVIIIARDVVRIDHLICFRKDKTYGI